LQSILLQSHKDFKVYSILNLMKLRELQSVIKFKANEGNSL